MTKLYHSPLFDHIKKYLNNDNSDDTIYIFVPYIKTKILEELLDGIKNKIVIVTTWNPKDIQFRSSDLTLYPFCKERNIVLYISENIHLKIYSVGLSSAILATGNISNRGLLPNGNYEAATMIKKLTNEDRLFFEKIRHEARLVNDIMYEELKKWSENNKVELLEWLKLKDIITAPRKDDFLISALPMTRSVDDLIIGYQRIKSDQAPSNDLEIAACIFHDLANYGIGSGLSKEEFLRELSIRFFEHPFIQKIDSFIAPEAYFGRIKEWVQDNCTDVPVPSRREITGNIQVLLEWFEKLGNGKYIIEIPGRKSQRIRKIKLI